MNRPKPEIGQTLYSLNVGNRHRQGWEQVLTPVTVIKVGRKYFTCAVQALVGTMPHTHEQYDIETWQQKTEFIANSKLYATPQEWEDEKEARKLKDAISKCFGIWGEVEIPLEKLRRIKAILDE